MQRYTLLHIHRCTTNGDPDVIRWPTSAIYEIYIFLHFCLGPFTLISAIVNITLCCE